MFPNFYCDSLLILCFVFLIFSDSFILKRTRISREVKIKQSLTDQRSQTSVSHIDVCKDDSLSKYQSLLHIKSEVTKSGNNVTDILLNLIKFGDVWNSKNNRATISNCSTSASEMGQTLSYEKVPGCMASVFIQTRLIADRTRTDQYVSSVTNSYEMKSELECNVTTRYLLKLNGFADSRVAQGMLALLIEGLSERCSPEDLIAMDPVSICEHFDFDKLLPPGRLNGFVNMIRLMQKQTKLELQRFYLDEEMSSNILSIEYGRETIARDPRKDEVAVLLSGGVDSSVALKLLQLQGVKVRAYYLKIWLEDEIAHLNQCPWEEDLQYAQEVCSQLGVPLETLSLQKEYWDQVVQYTLNEAKEGRTPNPDIMCNSRIKFGTFYDFVGRFHSRIATGHYAQVVSTPNGVRLVQSPDRHKDQSYFLSALSQQQLQRCVFPIGHLSKPQVRQLAEQFDLPTKVRKDSQGICFLGKLKFDDFIAHYLGTQSGPIHCYTTGRELGQHRGLWFHTIGQRKGLGLLLKQCVHDGPWFVAAKDIKSNILYVTNDINAISQPRLSFSLSAVNWIRGEPLELSNHPHSVNLLVKLRHGPSLVPAEITKLQGDDELISYSVKLKNRDKAIAPGQFAAFYSLRKLYLDERSDDEVEVEDVVDDIINEVSECLGAGVIADTAKDNYLLERLVKNNKDD